MKKKVNDLYKVFIEADVAYEAGEFKKAYLLFKKMALLGDPGAQNNLGNMICHGLGVSENKKKALYWYKKSWRSDRQSSTCINIGLTYLELNNTRRGIFWLKRAISLGDGDAMLDLAKVYLKRKGHWAKIEARNLLQSAEIAERIIEDSKEIISELLYKSA